MKKPFTYLLGLLAVLAVISLIYRSVSSRGNELYPTENSTCESDLTPNCQTNPDSINIRIGNRSEYNFCNIRLGDQVNFGNIAPGENSCYLAEGIIQPEDDVLLEINGRDYLVSFTEPLAEMESGNYTYEVKVIDMFNKSMVMWMVKD